MGGGDGRCPRGPRSCSSARSAGSKSATSSSTICWSTEQRTAPAGIRRAVEARDVHCVFAGCTAPAAWCDVHHVVHWALGGVTSCDNGALLCEKHHTAVHEGRFTIARDPGTAVWHTFRPDGTEIQLRGQSP